MNIHPLLAPYAYCIAPHQWSNADTIYGASVHVSGIQSEGRYQGKKYPTIEIGILGAKRTADCRYQIARINTSQGTFQVKGNDIVLPRILTAKMAEMLIGKPLAYLLDLPDCTAIITKINDTTVTFRVPDPVEPFIHTKESWLALCYNNRIGALLEAKVPASLKPGINDMSDADLMAIFRKATSSSYLAGSHQKLVLTHEGLPVTVTMNIRYSNKSGRAKIETDLQLDQDIKINNTGHVSFDLVSSSVAEGIAGMPGEKLIDHWVVRKSTVRRAESKVRKTVAYLDFEKITLRELVGKRLSLVERIHDDHLATM